jgi:lysozyme family protein
VSAKAHPGVDIANLTREQAEQIYFDDYWRAIRGNALPPALALVLFDAAVNMGVVASVRILQTVLRNVTVDGVMGPETVGSAKMFMPRHELVALALEYRLRWYEDLAGKDESSPSRDAARKKYGPYLYGWRMRVIRLALEAGRWRGL